MAKKISPRKIRETLKMDRAEFAEKAGVDVSTISRWETKGPPKKGTARAFLEQLAREGRT